MTAEEKARAFIRQAIADGRYNVTVAITGEMPNADLFHEVMRLLDEDEDQLQEDAVGRWQK